jgi:hypothetical protein
MKSLCALVFSLITVAAAAAQQPDAAFMQRALASLQAQRNGAMDAAAAAEAKAGLLTDELAKAQARLKQLEPKNPDAKQETEK